MLLRSRWCNRQRRSIHKRINKLLYGRRHFVRSYFNTDFLISSASEGGLQISAKILEYDLVKLFMTACREISPCAFIDVGSNLGLYSCIIMKNQLAPRAILFEPDRRNATYLRANLLINDLAGKDIEVHEAALGSATGTRQLAPGPESDIGRSTLTEFVKVKSGWSDKDCYDVKILRFDDICSFDGQTLAIKIDVEGYEREVISGMARTLHDNCGIVQVEVLNENRDDVVSAMLGAGYRVEWDFPEFPPTLIFRKEVTGASSSAIDRNQVAAPTQDAIAA